MFEDYVERGGRAASQRFWVAILTNFVRASLERRNESVKNKMQNTTDTYLRANFWFQVSEFVEMKDSLENKCEHLQNGME